MMCEFDCWWKEVGHFLKEFLITVDDGAVVTAVFTFGGLTIDPEAVNGKTLANWEEGYWSQSLIWSTSQRSLPDLYSN